MSKKDENSTETKESLAKKIWLAGLGAYGQGFDDAIEQYNKVNEKTSQLFGDLVKKGTDLEDVTRSKIEEVKAQSTESFDHRLNSVRQKLGLGKSEEEIRLDRLEAKIDALTEAVQALTQSKSTKRSKSTS